MRGDSLRDFYAKTIALLGLALVGAIGALIDYWPVSHPLPRVTVALPAPAPVRMARAETALMNAPEPRAEQVPVVRRHASHRAAPDLMSVRVASAADVVGSSSTWAFNAPAPPLASIAVQPITSLHATPVALVAPELTPESPVMVFAQHSSGSDPADQGFLSDATEVAKKAGTTIMSGTVKTGTSIVEGLRTFGGAVRRGLWRFVP